MLGREEEVPLTVLDGRLSVAGGCVPEEGLGRRFCGCGLERRELWFEAKVLALAVNGAIVIDLEGAGFCQSSPRRSSMMWWI